MRERRRSPRYKLKSNCSFYILDKETNNKFFGNLENISEEGVCIRISPDIDRDYVAKNLTIGSIISFQAFEKEDCFEAEANVLRIDEIDDEFSIGCQREILILIPLVAIGIP